MRTVTSVATAGWLLICPRGRPSSRQTEGKSLEVLISFRWTHVSGPIREHGCPWTTGKQRGTVLASPHGKHKSAQDTSTDKSAEQLCGPDRVQSAKGLCQNYKGPGYISEEGGLSIISLHWREIILTHNKLSSEKLLLTSNSYFRLCLKYNEMKMIPHSSPDRLWVIFRHHPGNSYSHNYFLFLCELAPVI